MFGDIIENPKGWPTDSLKNITDVRDGTHDSPKYVQDGYPFITSKNITNGDIDFSNVQYISKEDYQHIEVRSHVDDGDILMPMIGTVGGAIIVKKDRDFAIKNVCLIKFKNSEKVTNVFIKYVLNSEQMMSHLENIKKGGNQPFVSLGTLRSLNVVLPPLDIQKEFEKFVQQIDKSKFIDYSKYFLCDILTFVSSTNAYSRVVSIFVCPNICCTCSIGIPLSIAFVASVLLNL